MKYFLTICLCFLFALSWAADTLVVAKDGTGNYNSIQAAINAANNEKNRLVIYIKKGVYNEKLYIERDALTLLGESRDETIIQASIARDIWRCEVEDDWGVATMNILGNDLILHRLTIRNNYGFENEDSWVYCANDTTATKQKLVKKNGHQMALRTRGESTRLIAVDCSFISFGGDTVSPWEVNNGMWYFKDCLMMGAVDLFCPRGWAWAEDCEFVTTSGTAAVWHDGSLHEDSKMVLKNCKFSGYDNFYLGRYHRDAQFYLIDCAFASNMRDAAIYHAPSGVPLKWGHRVYYADCKKEDGKNFDWYKNNLPKGLNKESITEDWVFGKKWNPLGALAE